MTIKTTCIHPPIPIRCFNWSAIDADTYDGAPDSPNRNQIGYGATENDAVEDLKAQLIPETFMTTELGRLVNDLVNAAHKCGAAEDSTSGEEYEALWSAQVAAEKALLDYLECGLPPIPKPTEEGFGQLVSELINRTHECALAPDGYGCDAYLAQVAAEKRLLKYVEGIQRANKLLQHDYDDNKRWQKQVLADFKIAYDDHEIGRRLAFTQWMKDMKDQTEFDAKEWCQLSNALGERNKFYEQPLERVRDLIAKIGEQGDEIDKLREGVTEIVGCMDADHESSSYWAEKLRALLK